MGVVLDKFIIYFTEFDKNYIDKLLDFENKLFDEVVCSQKDNCFHK